MINIQIISRYIAKVKKMDKKIREALFLFIGGLIGITLMYLGTRFLGIC